MRFKSAAGIPGADLAVRLPPRLRLADQDRQGGRQGTRRAAGAHREGIRRRPLRAAGAVGRRIRLRRSAGAAEPHAPGIPGARGAGLGRAAPARLLGAGTAQRAGHRRARLEHAGGDARLLGRRHGAHPMDAGGLAQCRHRLRPGRPRVAVRQPGRCARLDRALSHRARQVPPRRALGLRGARQGQGRQPHLREPGRRPASSAPKARPSRIPPPRRGRGRRCRAGRRS